MKCFPIKLNRIEGQFLSGYFTLHRTAYSTKVFFFWHDYVLSETCFPSQKLMRKMRDNR